MRQGRREFRPLVTGLEGRQLMSNVPLTTVATFIGGNKSVLSPLVADAQGDLFGTASGGGEGGGKADATIFEIPAGSKTVKTLATFDGRAGAGISSLTLDAQGNLYGTTAGEGGSIGGGMAFEIAKGSTTLTPLTSSNAFGWEFPNGLVTDAQGNHFGTAAVGGASGVASAYEIAAGSSVVSLIAAFPGAAPAPKGLALDAQGDLFGTNKGGGPFGAGSIYEIARGSNIVTPIVTFDGIDGPGISNVVLDGQGNIYATTEDGGQFGDGTVIEIARGTNVATPLATFNGPNGTAPDPAAGVVRDAHGNLYGTTEAGGAYGYGTVFEVPFGTGTVVTLANFKNPGQPLVGGLTLDGQGNLYGTVDGSTSGGGSIFKISTGQ